MSESSTSSGSAAMRWVEHLTGLRRGLTQTRTFLAGLGFRWQRTRSVPVPPKSR